ncbi:hypothetical protein CTAYLR_009886 [Chrysophaeum taylorii]|uniref:Uncharacterized protein n=1 Tax=Chrysophaeum taylorii TaxID=2483200 RepID=A0AAD7UI80_9STRA|nr:hypothetical protein CTAYLR_009886 [Chrysophaeum taylorii]
MTGWFRCCDWRQTATLIAILVYTAFDLALWRVDVVSKPMKLLAVFVHEASHASACILTGGTVRSLEVNINEGGVTRFSGGWRRIVTPAGYLGGALWGAVGTTCCGTTPGQYVLVGLLGSGLLATLGLSLLHSSRLDSPLTTIGTCVFFLGVLAALLALHVLVAEDALRFGLLFVTTYISLFSVADIYDDCVARYVSTAAEKSDAVVCAKLCPILPARGWGVVWFLASLGLWFLGISFCLYLTG